MSSDTWILSNDLCRCCHAEGCFKILNVPCCNEDGETEVYSEMLREQLGVDIQQVDGILSESTYKICEKCIERLKDVVLFKKQVITCENKFKDLLAKGRFQAVKLEILNNEVKTEDDENEGYIGATDLHDSDSDDASFQMKFSDEDSIDKDTEDEPETKKRKGKSKVKARAKTKSLKKEKPKKESTQRSGNSSRFRLTADDYVRNGEQYVCKRCEKTYDKMGSLKYHIKTKHYKIPRYVCPYCQKEFMTPAPLTVHKLEAHNIDDRFKCNACKGTFNTKVQLRKHINNFHMMGEKYKCEFCEYESFSFEGMYKHKFKHKTVKDYHCRFCRKSFLRKTTLDLHERIHTGDRRKVCKVCGQAFVQKASLNYHMAKYHPEVNF